VLQRNSIEKIVRNLNFEFLSVSVCVMMRSTLSVCIVESLAVELKKKQPEDEDEKAVSLVREKNQMHTAV
jgi:hypothetical protein